MPKDLPSVAFYSEREGERANFDGWRHKKVNNSQRSLFSLSSCSANAFGHIVHLLQVAAFQYCAAGLACLRARGKQWMPSDGKRERRSVHIAVHACTYTHTHTQAREKKQRYQRRASKTISCVSWVICHPAFFRLQSGRCVLENC